MPESSRPAGFMPLESGIIVPIPEAEAAVGHLRSLHDAQARYGVPAHITLLYPFAHPTRVSDAVDILRQVFRDVLTFEFSLAEIRRFPATAYLHPEPSAPFVQLSEMLARQWPEFPPYGGAFRTVIPHLTVADRVTTDVLDMVDSNVSKHLPVRCRATEAWLMCSDDHGTWSRREVFVFRQNAK